MRYSNPTLRSSSLQTLLHLYISRRRAWKNVLIYYSIIGNNYHCFELYLLLFSSKNMHDTVFFTSANRSLSTKWIRLFFFKKNYCLSKSKSWTAGLLAINTYIKLEKNGVMQTEIFLNRTHLASTRSPCVYECILLRITLVGFKIFA